MTERPSAACLARPCTSSVRVMTSRPIALVTGASSGIGRAFAKALAVRGHDLVVVARREAELKALADEVDTEVEVLVADLSDRAQLARVEARAASTTGPIELLVNNAGFGTTGRFWELPVEREQAEIDVDVTALMRLTHSALPGMVERGRGAVLNVSSIGGFSPAAKNAVYAASKAFVLSFTLGVREELRGTGVKALALCPGYTRTEFQSTAGYVNNRLPSFLWHTSEQVVEAALGALGRDAGVCTPGLQYKAAVMTAALVPKRWAARVASMVSSPE